MVIIFKNCSKRLNSSQELTLDQKAGLEFGYLEVLDRDCHVFHHRLSVGKCLPRINSTYCHAVAQ